MKTTFFFLICTIFCALFCKKKRLAYLLIITTALVAWYQGLVNWIAIFALMLFTAANYISLHLWLSNLLKILLCTIMYAFILATMLDFFPGFFNLLVIHEVKISPLSIPFSMHINFGKAMLILILYVMHDPYLLEKTSNLSYQRLVSYTLIPCLCSIPFVFIPACLSSQIVFEPHVPDIFFIWALNNFFLVCMVEEVVFRGFLQNALQNRLEKYSSKSGLLAIIMTSFLFGLLHFRLGITYVLLATMASCLYGYSYYKTARIVCSMGVHFGLNVLHILLFTYPMAI